MSVLKKIGAVLLAVLAAGMAFFFLYVVKTPYYSLYRIHKAVQNHDIVLFEKHVDLDSIYSKGINDLIASGLKGKKGTGIDPFAAGIIKLLKPTVIQTMKDATLESVKKQSVPSGHEGDTLQKDNNKPAKAKKKKENAIPFVKKLKARLDVSNLKITDAKVTEKENNKAKVVILLHDKKLNKDFNLDLLMGKLTDGEWQIKEITNFVSFLAEVEKETKKAVKETAEETARENQ